MARGGRSSGSGLFRGSSGWRGGTRISFPLEFVVFKVADEKPRGNDVYCDVLDILCVTAIMLTEIERIKYFEVGRPNGRVVVNNRCMNSWPWRGAMKEMGCRSSVCAQSIGSFANLAVHLMMNEATSTDVIPGSISQEDVQR